MIWTYCKDFQSGQFVALVHYSFFDRRFAMFREDFLRQRDHSLGVSLVDRGFLVVNRYRKERERERERVFLPCD